MAITRNKKESTISKLKDIIKDAKTLVFVKFTGVTSEDANAMREAFEKDNVGYLVAKKTLIKKAFSESDNVNGEIPQLDGEIAISYGADIIDPARVIKEQGKTLGDKLEIVGGVFEGEYVNGEKMQSIADIPGMKTLQGMFVNIINSPIQSLAVALSQIADKKQ